MSDKRTSVEVKTTGPPYLAWRGELLAELALARLPGLVVHKRPERSSSDLPCHFLAATDHGLCFFVVVKGFSSSRIDLRDVDAVRELRWSIDADPIRRARASENPFILFLFDADTDHGRYLRLDTLPDPPAEGRQVAVRFPIEHTIIRETIEELIADLQREQKS
jgi:hypothetical protein